MAEEEAMIRLVREKEQLVASSPEHANEILWLVKTMKKKNDEEEEEEEEGAAMGTRTNRVSIAAMHSLRRVFTGLLLPPSEAPSSAPSDSSRKRQRMAPGGHDNSNLAAADATAKASSTYSKWLQTRLGDFLDCLLEWLTFSQDSNQREQALRTLMFFVERQRGSATGPLFPLAQGSENENLVPGMCGGGLFARIVKSLLACSSASGSGGGDGGAMEKARQRTLSVWINEYVNCYDDVRYHMLRVIRQLAHAAHLEMKDGKRRKKKRGTASTGTVGGEFPERAASLLMSFPMVDEQSDLTAFLVPPGKKSEGADADADTDDEEEDDMEAYDDEEEEEEDEDEDGGGMPAKRARSTSTKTAAATALQKMKDMPRVMTIRYQRKVFSDAWLAVLRLPLPSHIYKDVLLWLPENVMPHMGTPIRLADFLADSYGAGGISSVLALDSIFLLMTQHSLDYPKFYDSLLALITPTNMQARYRSRLFRMLDLCLRSSHLSTALVARFIKRLCRTALYCPPAPGIFALAMSQKLLELNPECMPLIRGGHDGLDGIDKNFASNPVEVLPSQVEDSASQRALGTSLWEVDGLRGHYYAALSSLAKGFEERGAGVGPSANMEPFSVLTYKSLFDQELSRKAKSVPLSFKKPQGLLDGADGLFSSFTLC